jgi:hypothetical protein
MIIKSINEGLILKRRAITCVTLTLMKKQSWFAICWFKQVDYPQTLVIKNEGLAKTQGLS